MSAGKIVAGVGISFTMRCSYLQTRPGDQLALSPEFTFFGAAPTQTQRKGTNENKEKAPKPSKNTNHIQVRR